MYKYITLFLLCALSWQTNAQSHVGIKGKAIEGTSKLPVVGAAVYLYTGNELGTQTVTNDFGDFVINTNYKGEAVLEINYLGFEPQLIEIVIADEALNLGLIALDNSSNELAEMVINTSLEEKQRALNRQRNSDNIKNIISSDLIGKFPDLNVAEALQRVPGVNISRDKGEGSTISLRGTPDFFTSIQINGEQIPSAQQSGARNESLDLIPADQLASMEITKAPTPDMDGDAIGGVVNLKTPVARKLKLGINGESAMGYNDISGNINGISKLRIDKRFFPDHNVTEGKLGVIVSGSYYQNNNSEDRIDAQWSGLERPIMESNTSELVMNNYQYRNTTNLRTRMGLTGTIDYKFNPDHHIIFNYMYNKREDNDLRNRLRFDMDRSGSVYHTLDSISDGRIRRDINIFDEIKENHSLNLQGTHHLSQWKVEWGAYYTQSKRNFTSQRGDFAQDGVDIVADHTNGIYSDQPNFRQAQGEQSMYDPFFYGDFRRYEEDYETTDADNMVGKIDVTRNYSFLGKYDAYFKVGGKIRAQTHSKYRDNRVFRFNDPNNLMDTEEAFLRSLSGKEPSRFLYSDYRFGPLIGRDEFQQYINDHRLLLTESDDAWDARRLSLSDTYDASENITSAYAMTRIQINKLMVLAGIRLEKTNVNYDAYEVVRIGTNVEGNPISGGDDYTMVLPNLHLKYNFDDYTILRFSTVFNYARPNFVDIVPFVNYDADAITLSLGNPELQPAKAVNVDLMFEKYFSNVGILSVGAFYKNINQFQFTRIDPSLQEDFPGYPGTQGFIFRQEQNGENAVVAGLELNAVRALDFLPGFLRHLSIDGNYTYTYSDAFTQDRDNISLPGQAAHTFNLALSADFGKLSARVSANYNGTFINSLASQPQDDIYQLARLQMDANASYRISKNWRIFTEFVNLTNEPSIRYQGERVRISRMAYFGWQCRVGLSFRY